MSLPEIAGHELQELIGSGCCGAVYKARAADGSACAVKVFSSMAINRRALALASQTLAALPPHPGVVTPRACGFERSPYFWVLPLYGSPARDSHGRSRWETPTLEDWCQEGLPAERAWELIGELAEALAWLHKHGLPHGNLRPCNVLVDESGETSLRLTDLAQGWVGGIHHLDLGDHFVYLCPEQAESPEGVFAGRGPGWDVYSFGVMAYRLLTGRLPRAEAAWARQLEQARQQVAAGLAYQIDSQALLQAVRAERTVSWPQPAGSPWEERRRQIIERALDLDPRARWTDMREVAREFEVLASDFLLEESRAQTVAERERQAGRVRSLTRTAAGLAAVLTLATGYAAFTWWRLGQTQRALAGSAQAHEEDIRQRQEKADAALAGRDARIGELEGERDRALAARKNAESSLRLSQAAADQFLTRLLQAPAGSEVEAEESRARMEEALAFCQQALAELEKQPQAGGMEKARMLGNIGRIHLRLRQDGEALTFLEKARREAARLAESAEPEDAAALRQAVGRHTLLLAGIKRRQGDDAAAGQLLAEAAPQLQAGLTLEPGNRSLRLEAARAWLDLGRLEYSRGQTAGAREALQRVDETLGEPSETTGEEEAFLSASGLFQLGQVTREEGRIEEALNQMIDAVRRMGELVMGSSPRNQDQALALAEAYTVLAELVGQHFSGKDALEAHQQAVPILLELNRLLPEWAEVKYLLARNNGAVAQLERDLGQTAEALRKKQDAIELINEVLADAPENPRYLFLQAKLRGEYAGFLADAGKASEAVAMGKLASASLEALLAARPLKEGEKMGPERRDWEVQLAQVCGLMGHASQKAGMKEAAKNAFTKAAEHWRGLMEAGRQDDVVKQGLAWTRDRLEKLQ